VSPYDCRLKRRHPLWRTYLHGPVQGAASWGCKVCADLMDVHVSSLLYPLTDLT
jgi:hypothetical protein